jgi:hypothetical protein
MIRGGDGVMGATTNSDQGSLLRHFWLLDNNVFNTLTSSKGGEAIVRLNHALDRFPELKNGTLTAIKLTPFGVLEAIGVVPPKPPQVQIPPATAKLEAPAVANYLMAEFEQYLGRRDELKLERLLELAETRKGYIAPEASELFDICVAHPLNAAGAEGTIKKCLAFDYLFKFQFSKRLAPEMHRFFVPLLFNTTGLQSHVGKFRFARRLWEQIYPDLVKSNPRRLQVLEAYNRSMSLKNTRDYLDCDIVHFLCIGYDQGSRQFPVVVFTHDDLFTTLDRIAIFKGVLAVARGMFEPAALESIERAAVSHCPGALVPCSPDGGFESYVRVADIPAFM